LIVLTPTFSSSRATATVDEQLGRHHHHWLSARYAGWFERNCWQFPGEPDMESKFECSQLQREEFDH